MKRSADWIIESQEPLDHFDNSTVAIETFLQTDSMNRWEEFLHVVAILMDHPEFELPLRQAPRVAYDRATDGHYYIFKVANKVSRRGFRLLAGYDNVVMWKRLDPFAIFIRATLTTYRPVAVCRVFFPNKLYGRIVGVTEALNWNS